MIKKIALFACCAVVVSIGWTATAHDIAVEMIDKAKHFLISLDADKKDQATFAFDDDERLNWHFIPRDREGLPYKEMTPAQRRLADRLLGTALSRDGIGKAFGIMYLDQILFEREGRDIRNSDNYFFTLFGEPSDEGAWGWRVEGHHLSLNVTLQDGEVVATSPAFMGSNPAIIRDGRHAGLDVLHEEQAKARALLGLFRDEARDKVIIDADAPGDIFTRNSLIAQPGTPLGLAVGDMTDEQANRVMELMQVYIGRMRLELAKTELDKINASGLDDIHFAWAGSAEPGEPHYYRIHGPTFLIEYDNTQNDANHVHSVWRDLTGDFGRDVLAEHYAVAHAGQ
jgi:hypothetical protein